MRVDLSIVGKKFNRLRVLEFIGQDKNKKSLFKCLCDCGNEGIFRGTEVKNGHTKSCGCFQKESRFKHGYNNTSIYQAYCDMKDRCYNLKNPYYKDYGERNIKVCEDWLDKETGFIRFLNSVGEKPDGKYSLGRIDNDLGYFPGNCRWETDTEQNRNLRSNRLLEYKGETKCVAEWTEISGLNKSTFNHRLRAGWSMEKIMTTPVHRPEIYSYKDIEDTLPNLAKMFNLSVAVFRKRLRRGWDIEEALETPQLYKRITKPLTNTIPNDIIHKD